jgi:hypothetical protein
MERTKSKSNITYELYTGASSLPLEEGNGRRQPYTKLRQELESEKQSS